MFFKFRKNKDKNKNELTGKIKYIVAGLGNPGDKYFHTRHNAGFLALDYISQKYNFKINTVKFKSLCAKYEIKGEENSGVLFMKPQTYMNNSGDAVAEAARFYKIPPENILVISDDVSLPAGKLRIRKSGSDGGQKGLKSIIYNLSTDEFPRIKIGAGEKPHPDYDMTGAAKPGDIVSELPRQPKTQKRFPEKQDMKDYVLSGFHKDEIEPMKKAMERACEALEYMVEGRIDEAMQRFSK